MDGKMAWAKSLEKHGNGTAGTAGTGQQTASSTVQGSLVRLLAPYHPLQGLRTNILL
jgi:hypothetical protein